MKNNTQKSERMRYLIANEAARIIVDQGDDNFGRARTKAAERLHCKDRHLLPDNSEIAQALEAYLQLYGGAEHESRQTELLGAAIQAMESLASFRPHLVGPILSGSATPHSPIQLHLYADYPEQLAVELLNRGIHYEEGDKELRFPNGEQRRYPVFRFLAGTNEMELTCFPAEELRSPPLSTIHNKPDAGAGIDKVRELLGARVGE